MAHMITSQCVNCGACEMECPVRAISAAANQYVIDPRVCVDCEGYFDIARCKWACPVEACVPQRAAYLEHSASLQNRGTRPVVFRAAGNPAGTPLAGQGPEAAPATGRPVPDRRH